VYQPPVSPLSKEGQKLQARGKARIPAPTAEDVKNYADRATNQPRYAGLYAPLCRD